MDIRIDNHGSIVMIVPVSPAGKEWVNEHLTGDEVQHWASGIVVEPRYVGSIIDEILGDGLVVGKGL